MHRKSEEAVVDECHRIQLPWSPDLRPGDTFRVFRTYWHGKKGFLLILVHKESLSAPKFKRVLRALKNWSRNDIHFRQYIRHWLHTFRPDRSSFTGRIVFRHAVLARRELFRLPTLCEYSDDYYRGRLVSPRWVHRAIEEAMAGEEKPFNAAEFHEAFERARQRFARQQRLRDEARKAGLYGVGLRKR